MTPGISTLLPGQEPDGKHILAVLLKRTYTIVPYDACVRAPADKPIYGGDRHYADPMSSSVEFEADFVPIKLATDVVLNGTAHAPGGRAVRELIATIEIGKVRKSVKIFGDRVCKHQIGGDPLFGDPQPFTVMPLRYERAYGGVDVESDHRCQFPYPRNVLGKGFAISNVKAAISGLELPNIEDPNDLLTPAKVCCGDIRNWAKQILPTGFGWYSKFSHPRAGWAGILPADRPVEQMMRQAYAELLPEPARALYLAHPFPSIDFRFFSGASPGLSLPYLTGDEAIKLTNLSPDGNLLLVLPGDRPAITLNIGDGTKEAKVVLHTVQIRMDKGEVDLVWRAAFPYPGPDWLPEMTTTEIGIHG